MTSSDVDRFVLSAAEAAYVVAALKLTLEHYGERLLGRDRERITLIMQRLTGGLDLSDEVRLALDS